jgi:phage terminase large subunit-like protein
MCVFFSGEEPESLRGPQCELCVIDEIGRMRYQQAVFDTMMLGLRLGDKPRVLLATTPRTTPFMKRLGREPINLQGRSAGQSPLCPVATKFRSAGKCREWDGPAVLLPLTAFNWGL